MTGAWWRTEAGRATETESLFADFWESQPSNVQKQWLGLCTQREALRAAAKPHFDSFYQHFAHRREMGFAVAVRVVAAAARGELDRHAQLGASMEVAQAWLDTLPSGIIAVLHAHGQHPHRRALVDTILSLPPQRLIVPPLPALDTTHVSRPSSSPLRERIVGSAAWSLYARDHQDHNGVHFQDYLRPDDRKVLRELGGAAFETALAEILETYRTYDARIQRLTARIQTEAALTALFTHPNGTRQAPSTWLSRLPLAVLHGLHCVSEWEDPNRFIAAIARRRRDYPESYTGTTPTTVRRNAPTPTPVDTGPPPPEPARYRVDCSYVGRELRRLGDAVIADVATFAQAIARYHGDREWMQQHGVAPLNGVDGMFSARNGITGRLRFARLIYWVHPTVRYIRLYFIGTHEDYNHVVSRGNERTLRAWVTTRRALPVPDDV